MSELSVNRRNTEAFIAARPTNIALIPVSTTQTASGGIAKADLPARATQTFRLIEQTSTTGNNPGRIAASDGHQLKITWQLLGTYDSQMAVGDHWTDAPGAGYQIQELLPDNGYERRARVVAYGPGQ